MRVRERKKSVAIRAYEYRERKKAKGLRKKEFWVTAAEHVLMKQYLRNLREANK